MITKINYRYSFEVLDFNCNGFGFTFNIGVPYLGIIIRHQCLGTKEIDIKNKRCELSYGEHKETIGADIIMGVLKD